MSWLDRLFRPRPLSAGDRDLAELLKTVEPVVRAYAEVVAESDSFVYRESELVHSKDKIRAALRAWAVCELDPDARRQLRMLYGLLEDFLPEGEWRLLERWHGAAKRHDYQGVAHAGRQATELLQTLAERRQRREEEFEEYLTQGAAPVFEGLGGPPPPDG